MIKTIKEQSTVNTLVTNKLFVSDNIYFVNVQTVGESINSKHVVNGIEDKYNLELRPLLSKLSLDEILESNEEYDEIIKYFVCSIDNIEHMNEYNLYYSYWNNDLLFDENFKVIPLLKRYDYCGTCFRSDRVDIVKAKAILEQHPFVKYISDIKEVPYYNQNDRDDLQYLEVHIQPDIDSYNKVFLDLFSKDRLSYLNQHFIDYYGPTIDNNVLGLLDCIVSEKEDIDEEDD